MTNPDGFVFTAFCPFCKEPRDVSAIKTQIREGGQIPVHAFHCDHSWNLTQDDSDMETSDHPKKSTEERLRDSILQVQSAAFSKQIFHLSHVFTGDPSGCFAVNSVFVTCEDELAPALHERLDATVREFFREHAIVFQDSLNKEVDEHKPSEDKVVPIFGPYKGKDGRVYMHLDPDGSENLDRVSKLTGLDRDAALNMAIERYLEKMKSDPEFRDREKKKYLEPEK